MSATLRRYAQLLFAPFERWVKPYGEPPGPPPQTIGAFYWHFVKQAKAPFVVMFVLSALFAMADLLQPYLLGRIVDVLSKAPREEALSAAGGLLVFLIFTVLILRPLLFLGTRLVMNQTSAVSFPALGNWQNFWHVTRQPLNFFTVDFAGRI
ncbi:MAG: multidrug ABC transporter ATP-binding protein, partial [Beijerinckiaceae bacterium]